MSVIDYLFTFDINPISRIKILNTLTKFNLNDTDSIDIQLDNLLDILIPTNLFNYPNIEHYTFIPISINISNGNLSINHKEELNICTCYIYTISYYDNNNNIAKGISIISQLPLLTIFKPFLVYLLHDSFNNNINLNTIYHNLNNSKIDTLFNHYQKINSPSRFVLSRIQPDTKLNDSLKLPSQLYDTFIDTDNLFKTSINLNPINFPINIPKLSLISSNLALFGIDLQNSSNLKNFINFLNNINININGSTFMETSITPYENINPLNILLNALILKKKIIFFANKSCYNNLNDYIIILYLIFNSSNSLLSNDLTFYPIIDLNNLNLLNSQKNYLIGTSNHQIISKLDWNIFLNFDSNTLNVQCDIDNTNINTLDPSINSNYSSFLMTPSTSFSNISKIDSLKPDLRLNNWNPSCFPKIINNYTIKNSSNVHHTPITTNFSSIPRIDNALLLQINKLIKNNHNDETLFILITNYLRNLTTKILPSFYHFINFLKINDFKSIPGNDNDYEIKKFIKENNIIQPFPLNHPFNSQFAYLNDSKILIYYTKIVLSNLSLLSTSINYNSNIFQNTNSNIIPGFLFSWNGGSDDDDEIFIRLDTHYLISILDKMIDGTSSESWQLNKFLLLQIFKILNSILKINRNEINGLNYFLIDLFIEKRGDESFTKSYGTNLFKSNNNSNNKFLKKLNQLSISSTNLEILKDLIINNDNNENENIKSRRNSIISNKSENKSTISTELNENDELLSHISTLGSQRFIKLILVSSLYLSIRGPEDLIETNKGIRRKDLLLTEFKRFLSSVLNDKFFKEFVLVEMDDFVKLTVNDFIDYHM